jgi:hypothetical protein
LQITLQRCPRNSLEQLGQIDDTSFFFADGSRLATARLPPPILGLEVGVSTTPVRFNACDMLPNKFGFKGMLGVVAQIGGQENLFRGKPVLYEIPIRSECRPPRQFRFPRSTVDQQGAVPKW